MMFCFYKLNFILKILFESLNAKKNITTLTIISNEIIKMSSLINSLKKDSCRENGIKLNMLGDVNTIARNAPAAIRAIKYEITFTFNF